MCLPIHYQYKRKTWKGEMIKSSLETEEECNTYLTHVCRYSFSIERSRWKHKDQELSANTVTFISWVYFYSWWKPQCWLKAPDLKFSLWTFHTLWPSTDMSQVLLLKVTVLAESSWSLCFHCELSTVCGRLQTWVR